MKRTTAFTLLMGLAASALAAEPGPDTAAPPAPTVEAVEPGAEAAAPQAIPDERPGAQASPTGPAEPAVVNDAATPAAEVVSTPVPAPAQAEPAPAPRDLSGKARIVTVPVLDAPSEPRPRGRMTPSGICTMLENAADAYDLPAEFFARVIWQESAFNAHAVSPKGAQGVAQFMPATAVIRGLADPFDPAPALRQSARFLRDLRSKFGNLGLAAAGYNAGPGRVQDWLDGRSRLPLETRNYVLSITGRPADDWARARALSWSHRVADGSAFRSACQKRSRLLTAARRRELLPTPPVMVARAAAAADGRAPAAAGGRTVPAMPWSVELAADYKRQTEAERIAAEIRRRHDGLLRRSEPVVIEAKMADRKALPRYRIRIGTETRDNADKLCTGLQAAGSPCLVMDTSREPAGPTVASRRDTGAGPAETKLGKAREARLEPKAGPKRDRALEEGPKLAVVRGRPLGTSRAGDAPRGKPVAAKAVSAKLRLAAKPAAKAKVVRGRPSEPAPKRVAQSTRS